ncbi:MAG: HEAT repeat domain-containing protein [Planctomycetes bacterium]|nr:HEAT repeat domain-containing protein [Planctomycetota bacterium]
MEFERYSKRAQPPTVRCSRTCSWVLPFLLCAGSAAKGQETGSPDAIVQGKQLFEREWQPNDPRSHGGDGLGPLFNGRSCVACHHLGGTGGAGPASKNVQTLTFRSRGSLLQAAAQSVSAEDAEVKQRESDILTTVHPGFRSSPSVVLHLEGTEPGYIMWRTMIASLAGPGGFSPRSRSLRGSQELQDRATELRMKLQRAEVTLIASQRNTTAIFGAALIDSVPDETIEAVAKAEHAGFPKVRGRIARLPDGRIGRFGWKAQMPSLEAFTRAACAMELGLEVPGHSQSTPTWDSAYSAPGLDLSEGEVQSLVKYLRSLPAPRGSIPMPPQPDGAIDASVDITALSEFLRDKNPSYRRAAARELERRGDQAREAVPALVAAAADPDAGVADAAGHALAVLDPTCGQQLFERLGCATCHVPALGSVEGIYSDLLLHDMGARLADSGEYYGVPRPDLSAGTARSISPRQGSQDNKPDGKAPERTGPPSPQEWRTPPLWGCRDSAPYLHDGRAPTLEAAISAHDGEAADSGSRFARLSPGERLLLASYLQTLGAPTN